MAYRALDSDGDPNGTLAPTPPEYSPAGPSNLEHKTQTTNASHALGTTVVETTREGIPTSGYGKSRYGCRLHGTAWTLELLSLSLSVTSLLAAAVVLGHFNEKPLDEWRFVTSINTIISILGVISKATLAFAVSSAFGQHKWNWFRTRQDELRVFVTFDEATRGPLGGIKLLFWSKAR